MPYIKQDIRNDIKIAIDNLIGRLQEISTESGVLNYVISEILGYTKGKRLCYQEIQNIIGILECAKLEFYRRIAVPYENRKWIENGDISSYQKIMQQQEFKELTGEEFKP